MTASNFNLRGIPPQVMSLLKREAKGLKISVNQLILRLVEQAVGYTGKPKRAIYHDLDFMIGTLSKKENREFEERVKIFEKIDEELWK